MPDAGEGPCKLIARTRPSDERRVVVSGLKISPTQGLSASGFRRSTGTKECPDSPSWCDPSARSIRKGLLLNGNLPDLDRPPLYILRRLTTVVTQTRCWQQAPDGLACPIITATWYPARCAWVHMIQCTQLLVLLEACCALEGTIPLRFVQKLEG
ncbi:hypothetical protein BDZ85DRAFT_40667 [Elsinoe ampelina]|uniref:Uncharacterized protein n=1 Tax=Elsinoe ampelina TaxID=302913 RepID=A0A6A6G207_9PEZI|nr:hypothetical protein BDZ85DRAFT_40667 [Elsinoe ampelina]